MTKFLQVAFVLGTHAAAMQLRKTGRGAKDVSVPSRGRKGAGKGVAKTGKAARGVARKPQTGKAAKNVPRQEHCVAKICYLKHCQSCDSRAAKLADPESTRKKPPSDREGGRKKFEHLPPWL